MFLSSYFLNLQVTKLFPMTELMHLVTRKQTQRAQSSRYTQEIVLMRW